MDIAGEVLITGGSGTLGKAIQRVVHYDGRYLFLNSKAADLLDAKATLEMFKSLRPRKIIHTAALSGGIGLLNKLPATVLHDNAIMDLNVLEAARQIGVEKLIMTLSTGMYPNVDTTITESMLNDGPPNAAGHGYAMAKRLTVAAISAYRKQYKLPVVGLVPNGIFGPGDNFNPDEGSMLASLIVRFYNNKNGNDPIEVWGDGSQIRSYTYADDLARAYLWCLHHYDEDEILNIGTIEEFTVGEAARWIADNMHISRNRIAFDTSKPSGQSKRVVSNAKFIGLSKFSYTPFIDGLARTVTWYEQTMATTPTLIRRAYKLSQEKKDEVSTIG